MPSKVIQTYSGALAQNIQQLFRTVTAQKILRPLTSTSSLLNFRRPKGCKVSLLAEATRRAMRTIGRPKVVHKKLKIGLYPHHSEYLERSSELNSCNKADIIRAALDEYIERTPLEVRSRRRSR